MSTSADQSWRGAAEKLARRSARLALVVDGSGLEVTVAAAAGSRGKVTALQGDVTDPGLPTRVAATVDADILVNNVGHYVRPKMEFAASTEADWESLRAVNLAHVLS